MKTLMSFSGQNESKDSGQTFALVGLDELSLPYNDAVTEQTRRTAYQHFQNLAHLNLEQLTRQYSGGARLNAGNSTHEGIDAITFYYKTILQELAGQHTKLRFFHVEIQGKLAFMTWDQYSETTRIAFGATTFLVERGFIVWQQIIAIERKEEPGIQLY